MSTGKGASIPGNISFSAAEAGSVDMAKRNHFSINHVRRAVRASVSIRCASSNILLFLVLLVLLVFLVLLVLLARVLMRSVSSVLSVFLLRMRLL
jgi:hypothetical protein